MDYPAFFVLRKLVFYFASIIIFGRFGFYRRFGKNSLRIEPFWQTRLLDRCFGVNRDSNSALFAVKPECPEKSAILRT